MIVYETTKQALFKNCRNRAERRKVMAEIRKSARSLERELKKKLHEPKPQ